jgi:hypothetical protein
MDVAVPMVVEVAVAGKELDGRELGAGRKLATILRVEQLG